MPGISGGVYEANTYFHEKPKMSMAQKAENLNIVLDKIHQHLNQLEEVQKLPIFAKQSKLRTALSFVKTQLEMTEGFHNGYCPGASLMLLFVHDLKALTTEEGRTFTEYIAEQSGAVISGDEDDWVQF